MTPELIKELEQATGTKCVTVDKEKRMKEACDRIGKKLADIDRQFAGRTGKRQVNEAEAVERFYNNARKID